MIELKLREVICSRSHGKEVVKLEWGLAPGRPLLATRPYNPELV